MIYQLLLADIIQDNKTTNEIHKAVRMKHNTLFIGGELLLKKDVLAKLQTNVAVIATNLDNMTVQLFIPTLGRNWRVLRKRHTEKQFSSWGMGNISDVSSYIRGNCEYFYMASGEDLLPDKDRRTRTTDVADIASAMNKTLKKKQAAELAEVCDSLVKEATQILVADTLEKDRPKNSHRFRYRETERIHNLCEQIYNIRHSSGEDFITTNVLKTYIQDVYPDHSWYTTDIYDKIIEIDKTDAIFRLRVINWLRKSGYIKCI